MERTMNMDAGWKYDAPVGVFKNPARTQNLLDIASARTGRLPELFVPFGLDDLAQGYVELQVLPPDTVIKPGRVYQTTTRRVMVREFGIGINLDAPANVPNACEKRLVEHMEAWLTSVYAWTLLPELRRTAVQQATCACGEVLTVPENDFGRRHVGHEHLSSCARAQVMGITFLPTPGRTVAWYGKGFLRSEWDGEGVHASAIAMVPNILPINETAFMSSEPDPVPVTCLVKTHAPGCICETLK